MNRSLEKYGRPVLTFRIPGYRMELRRSLVGAPENTVAIMYRQEGEAFKQAGIGIFKGGEWRGTGGKPLDVPGLYWAEPVSA